MNKKELAEIKRQFKMENEDIMINNIGVYYIDKENNIICSEIKRFAEIADMVDGSNGNPNYWEQLDEENFLEIFKKTLSGQLGKSLVEYSFPNEILMGKNNCYTKLLNVFDDDLETKSDVDNYVKFVAESINKEEEYAICLLSCTYNLPTKDSNGNKTSDDDLKLEGEEFHFMLLSICPITLTNIGLFYDRDKTKIVHKKNTDKVLGMPIKGFLFPVFNDRSEDINGVLVFNKKSKEPDLALIQTVLGCNFIMNAEEERDKFNTLITKVISNDDDTNTSIDYEITKTIHSIISEKIANSVLDTELPTLSKHELKSILERSGVSESNLEKFDEVFEDVVDNDKYQFKAVNVINASKLDIKSPDIVINVKSDKTDKIKAKQIDGKRCLVVELDETVDINGLNVNIK